MQDSSTRIRACLSQLKVNFKKTLSFWLLIFMTLIGLPSLWASESFLPPLRESEAFKQYQKRHQSELSKLIYLIDRYKDTKVQVLYDGAYYDTDIAVRIVRWFLGQNYKNGQTSREWIERYATTTIMYGTPIFFKLPDGTLRLARDLFWEELQALEEAMKQESRRR